MTVLALPLLFNAVRAQFVADDSDAVVVFGWKEVAKQINQGPGGANRIVFKPGDKSNKGGPVLAPDKPGRNPRPLYTLNELFDVYIWAVDARALDDELAQVEAARLLHDQVLRALYLVTHTDGDKGLGPVAFGDWQWNKGPIERPFGAEIIQPCSIAAMVPDAVDLETTEADHVTARIPVVSQGVTMTIEAPAA